MTSAQRRQILRMVFGGSEPPVSACPRADREVLVSLGLLAIVHRGRASHLVLTDRAWEQAPALMAEEASHPGPADLARTVLAAVHAYTSAHDIALADFLRPLPPPPTADQVRAAYFARTGGRGGQRVRLADLRDALGPLDEAVRELLTTGTAHLLTLDDPLDRRPRDEAAAVHVGGHPRHLLVLEHP